MPTARVSALVLVGLATAGAAGQVPPPEPERAHLATGHPAIGYHRPEADDPVARLAAKVDADSATLRHDERFGFLPSLLEHLEVPMDSQGLVFSKTSLLSNHISPQQPRAIYFSDEVAIGYVPNTSTVELMAFVPGDGARLYTVSRDEIGVPRFAQPNICLHCHHADATLGVPGPYVGSVSTAATGRPDFTLGTVVTDHRTPFEERWGGWYVSGTHGTQRHRGNSVARAPSTTDNLVAPEQQNLVSLDRFIDTDDYLVPTSDLVALMTLEHQTHLLNLLTRADWEARVAEHDGALDGDESRERATLVEEIVRYMLFADETPLSAPVRGVSTFTQTFETAGPRDEQGRSLRHFDLTTRLFRYRLSYLIYSPLFDELASQVRDAIYTRLLDVLKGRAAGDYPHLPAPERRAILQILVETKTGLPEGWRVPR